MDSGLIVERPLLNIVAKANFGFSLVLGTGHANNIRAYHGYADVDPDIERELGAIEVFDVIDIQQAVPEKRTRESSGDNISVEIDDLPELRAQVSDVMERQFKLPVDVGLRSVELEYSGSNEVSLIKRQSDLDGWQEGVAATLAPAGFRALTKSDFAGTPFRDEDDMASQMLRSLPFGSRDLGVRLFRGANMSGK